MRLTVLNDVIHGIRVNRKLEQQILDSHIHLLDIKMAGTDQLAVELSGGNQQKVVISKWLAANPRCSYLHFSHFNMMRREYVRAVIIYKRI